MNIQVIWEKIGPTVKNKFFITFIVFLLYVLFFDQNNLMDRFEAMSKLKQLKKDKEYFIQKIDEDTKRMNELKTNNENLEKFAREQYLMKKPNEDVFIIVEED
jgi:cell division protein DivIC